MLVAALALSVPLMVSCRSSAPPVETTAGFGPGYPAGSAGWSVKEREVYRAAFDAGRRDQREGYRYDDDRVTVPLKEELRSFSRQGYRAGYYHQAAARRAGGGSQGPAAPAPASVVPSAGFETSAGNGLGWGFGPGPGPASLAEPSSPPPPPKPKPKPKPLDPFAVPLEGTGAEAGER